MCINYKKLNARTVTCQSELPDINDILDKLAPSKIFSSIDLKAGYNNLEVHLDSQ